MKGTVETLLDPKRVETLGKTWMSREVITLKVSHNKTQQFINKGIIYDWLNSCS